MFQSLIITLKLMNLILIINKFNIIKANVPLFFYNKFIKNINIFLKNNICKVVFKIYLKLIMVLSMKNRFNSKKRYYFFVRKKRFVKNLQKNLLGLVLKRKI